MSFAGLKKVNLSNSGINIELHLVATFVFSLSLQLNNPDMRVVLLKDFVKKHFPATSVLDYAIEVEKITTSKVL